MATRDFSDLIAEPNTNLAAAAVGDYILIYDASEPLDIYKIKVISIQDVLKLTTETARQPMVTGQAAGDLFYASAAGVLARLAKGTANQILKMKSDASIPEWAEIAKNYVRVGRDSSQTLGNGSYVDISFNVEYQDTAGMWAAGSPTIFTVSKAGVYLIGCTIIFAINATGVRQTKLIVKRGGSAVDGTLVDTRSALTGVSVNVNLCAIAVLEVGDTINVEVWQTQAEIWLLWRLRKCLH